METTLLYKMFPASHRICHWSSVKVQAGGSSGPELQSKEPAMGSNLHQYINLSSCGEKKERALQKISAHQKQQRGDYLDREVQATKTQMHPYSQRR
ncbi:hypothetical protein Tco_1031826 [Tanacetum coccineum]|uniref:Uncharacterized protein n=1 Tax=Tanacetum coccineum TaxID=301880 RepID=A0ABQ5GBK8_9ASTR